MLSMFYCLLSTFLKNNYSIAQTLFILLLFVAVVNIIIKNVNCSINPMIFCLTLHPLCDRARVIEIDLPFYPCISNFKAFQVTPRI